MQQVGIRCQFCVDVDLDALVSEAGYRHHASWENLIASADQGCELCKLIERWQHTAASAKEDQVGSEFIAPRIRIGDTVVDKLTLVTDAEDQVTKLYQWNGIARDNQSDACFHRIFHWIKQCSTTHSGTCAPFRDHPLPTRLIDVGLSAASEPCLLVTTTGSKGRWLTLSHCWGEASTMSLKTILSNYQEHQKGIPFSKFPRSFQDAITITRHLGFRYIWIDSLCIIQDSKADWLVESSQMGRVYRDSALTIVADEAKDSTQGIFAAAIRQGKDWPTYIDVNYHSNVRGIQGTMTFRSPSIDVLGNIPSPLSRRAWTLQETTLSPRVLRYSHEELFWSCSMGNFSESSPDISLSGDRDHKIILASHHVPDHSSYNLELMQSYYGLIRDYAFRKLTFASDRFVALSGLSKLVAERSGYNFIAGLWSEDIHRGLLWVTPGDFIRVDPYIAPTWSWASVLAQWEDFTIPEIPLYEDHVIYGIVDTAYPRAEIIDVGVNNNSDAPFGQVKEARIVMRAPIMRFEELEGVDAKTVIEDTDLNRLTYEFDTEIEDLQMTKGCFDDLRGKDVVCVQIARLVYQDVGKIFALVLEPGDIVGGTWGDIQSYQRIGRVVIPEEDGFAQGWDVQSFTIW